MMYKHYYYQNILLIIKYNLLFLLINFFVSNLLFNHSLYFFKKLKWISLHKGKNTQHNMSSSQTQQQTENLPANVTRRPEGDGGNAFGFPMPDGSTGICPSSALIEELCEITNPTRGQKEWLHGIKVGFKDWIKYVKIPHSVGGKATLKPELQGKKLIKTAMQSLTQTQATELLQMVRQERPDAQNSWIHNTPDADGEGYKKHLLKNIDIDLLSTTKRYNYFVWYHKFWVAIYNGTRVDAIKYSEKLDTQAAEQMEFMAENPDIVTVHSSTYAGPDEIPTFVGEGQGAYLKFCNHSKALYDLKQLQIKYMCP